MGGENQPQSVEGWKNDIHNNIAELAERIVIDYANLSGREDINRAEFRKRTIDNIISFATHQQSEVLENVRKTIQEKKVTNDFAKRHPESYKYELGWDAALDDILSSLSNNKS